MWAYLNEHPQIFLSDPKEPHAFGTDLDSNGTGRFEVFRNPKRYASLFAGATAPRVGEASAYYIFSKSAASDIKAYNPEAKIMIMLRNPVDMVYSLYWQQRRIGNEDLVTFEAALAAEPERSRGLRLPRGCSNPLALRYTEAGKFTTHVRRFLDTFGPSRVLCLLLEDVTAKPAETYKKTLAFLEVDDTFTPSAFSVHNEAVLVRNPWLHKQLASARAQVRRGTFRYKRQLQQLLWVLMMANLKNGRPPALEPRTRALLLETFRRDVQELQVLLGRDLSSWLARR